MCLPTPTQCQPALRPGHQTRNQRKTRGPGLGPRKLGSGPGACRQGLPCHRRVRPTPPAPGIPAPRLALPYVQPKGEWVGRPVLSGKKQSRTRGHKTVARSGGPAKPRLLEPPLPLAPGSARTRPRCPARSERLALRVVPATLGSHSRWARRAHRTSRSLIPAPRSREWQGLSVVPARRPAWDSGPGGATLRQPHSSPSTARKQRTGGSAVELGSA